MSAINSIASTQSPVPATAGKFTAQQSATTSQPQPTTSSSVAISQAGTAYANYLQHMAQAQEAQSQHQANAFSDPAQGASYAYALAHDSSMTNAPIGGLLSIDSKATGPFNYASGAPVTVASQAYFTKQNDIYQNQLLELYNTEKAKGTAPGHIVGDIYNLQAKQPDAFRAMMMWTPAADPSSIQTATNTSGSTTKSSSVI